MTIFSFILLSTLQLAAGHGLVSKFRLALLPLMHLSLSLLCGVAIFSFIPFMLELLTVPLTLASVGTSLVFVCILCNFPGKHSWLSLLEKCRQLRLSFTWYTIPYVLVAGCMILISIWRCYYLPPTPRDLTSGAEVIAEYAVREKSMINSVFTVNLETTNNQFKPPFITSLQLIYKYAGFPFGQVWLSTIFVAFLGFLYAALRSTLHPVIAGILLVAFLAIPEMYVYSFIALFDYPNAVFFSLSCWFLVAYFRTPDQHLLFFAASMMAVATYIRSETLLLAGLLSAGILIHPVRKRYGILKLLKPVAYFLIPSIVAYLFSVTIYTKFYLPVDYPVGSLLNQDLTNLSPLFNRFADMNGKLLFGERGLRFYGYFIYLFLLVFISDAAYARHISGTAKNWLFAVGVVYFGLPLLGYLLPLMDLFHTTKRGLFKLFPLMLIYLANTKLLMVASEKFAAWESPPLVRKQLS